MKILWNSFLQTVIQFLKDLIAGMTKAMHRNAVLMTAGISVVTMLTVMAIDLNVGGSNALVAFAETQEYRTETETELEEADSEELATDEKETKTELVNETETAAPTDVSSEETDVEEDKEMEDPEVNLLGITEEEKRSLPGYEEIPVMIEVKKTEPAISLSDSDYNTLLRIVQAESGSQDIMGRILVANVILNRVESKEFPNSIHGVVYQKSQFSPVIDGSINRCKITEETREAVDRALRGEDPSEGALYFSLSNC